MVPELLFAHACRAGEAASEGLTETLLGLGFETDRLKTGTPARVDKRSIDFTHLEAQPGDEQVKWFSFDEEVCPDVEQHQTVLCSSTALLLVHPALFVFTADQAVHASQSA